MFEGRQVIVTLTTIPSRANGLDEVVISILGQTVKPDQIIISLPKESVREPKAPGDGEGGSGGDPYTLDPELAKFLKRHQVKIHRPKRDYGPATKLLGVLEIEMARNLPPESEGLIIVLDDDKYYHPNTVKNLLEGWSRNRDCVVAQKGNFYQGNQECLLLGCNLKADRDAVMIFGTGGVLYRASYFRDDIFDFRKTDPCFPKDLFFTIDDSYLSGYLHFRGIKKRVVAFPKTPFQASLSAPPFDKIRGCSNLDPSSKSQATNPLRNINTDHLKNRQAYEYFFRGGVKPKEVGSMP